MILELQKELTYGPVRSRRLGASLGINLFPGNIKRCPFDCVYCHFGWTKKKTLRLIRSVVPLASPSEIEKAVSRALDSLPALPAYLTFSGNGEPTVHPDFPEMVDRIVSLRKKYGDGMRTAVLSNSARVMETDVRAALARLDARIMKLDCGTEEVFRRYNRPAQGIGLEAITEGLSALAAAVPVVVQALFAGGSEGNLEERHASAWVDRVERIRAVGVQLYTLARGYPANDLRPASTVALANLAAEAVRKGVPVRVYS